MATPHKEEETPKAVLCAFGNALVDIIVEVGDDFLKKHKLIRNQASEVDDKFIFENVIDKFKDVASIEVGGSAMNTTRMAQWALQRKNIKFCFMGCIGKDTYGLLVEKTVEDSGAVPCLMKHESEATGKCAALVTGDERTFAASVGASRCFSKSFLQDPVAARLLNESKFIYVEGFFLTHNVETADILAKLCLKEKKPFLMNLSGVYICREYYKELATVLPYVDVLFGNEDEAAVFSQQLGIQAKTTIGMAMEISKLCVTSGDGTRCCKRMVIITQGKQPVIVVREGELRTYPVPEIMDIVDTIGGGDAFTAGFLAMFVQGESIDACITCGIYCGTEMVKRKGFTIPTELNSCPLLT